MKKILLIILALFFISGCDLVDDFNDKYDKKAVDKEIEKFFKENDKLEIREFEYDKYSFEHLESFDMPFLEEYSSAEIQEIQYRDEYRSYYRRRESQVNGAPSAKTKFSRVVA